MIQRFLPNLPNEHSGGWVDEAVVRDLKAEDAEQAVQTAAQEVGQSDPSLLTAKRRAIRWDTTEEYETRVDGVASSKATKVAPG